MWEALMPGGAVFWGIDLLGWITIGLFVFWGVFMLSVMLSVLIWSNRKYYRRGFDDGRIDGIQEGRDIDLDAVGAVEVISKFSVDEFAVFDSKYKDLAQIKPDDIQSIKKKITPKKSIKKRITKKKATSIQSPEN